MQTRRIMNYLYGVMSSHDKIQFENDLKEQEDLKKELLLQQEIDYAIKKEMKVDKFKATLNKIHEEQIDKKAGKIINLQNKWYWAAASITIFSGTAIYSLKNHLQSNNNLFESYYQVWKPSVITRGQESEQFSKGIVKEFEKGNFSEVIELLEAKQAVNSLDPKLLLLKGCAEMEIHDYDAAIETFALFDSKDYTFYTEAGQWYQALCYLKNEELDKSIHILTILVERNTSYASDASELLNKLN